MTFVFGGQWNHLAWDSADDPEQWPWRKPTSRGRVSNINGSMDEGNYMV